MVRVAPLERITGPTSMYGPPVLVQVWLDVIKPETSVDACANPIGAEDAKSKPPIMRTKIAVEYVTVFKSTPETQYLNKEYKN
jgi:hypothetical protein